MNSCVLRVDDLINSLHSDQSLQYTTHPQDRLTSSRVTFNFSRRQTQHCTDKMEKDSIRQIQDLEHPRFAAFSLPWQQQLSPADPFSTPAHFEPRSCQHMPETNLHSNGGDTAPCYLAFPSHHSKALLSSHKANSMQLGMLIQST